MLELFAVFFAGLMAGACFGALMLAVLRINRLPADVLDQIRED